MYKLMLIPTIFNDYPECIPKKGILHVGAHSCEEKELYNSIGIVDKNILWIEADINLVKKYITNNNIIHAVISNKDNESVNFNITNNEGQSSSILNLKTHKYEHPNVYVVEVRNMKTITLNTLFQNYNIAYDTYDFINLDIQGAELFALQGQVVYSG